ncbi:pyridoxine/pyridoxamine 5'-phosphate oxidase [[Haemophilus] ducreyi]|uniref:Pyridoxine/pyridoxamine 5'-phosphate oxidase n=1 Tax=Haemophilus ducreyi (strain 35000HP / ATCC 700724) TaxID=233412 RepID=PDXH_HAEDU|nr:pyridoxamine 5'-phosphate oxidase [[Haemophilus] ducreyi]Q7VP83.1 RecName: Full=Pyridoxine/pyridoxamine 5'-phosphate oxidase; AltName: Full=PNP/PMP oxidase; Short=PNPOx; AltName: Full=Pyridoxal 5'-phosphate synthase [[Haemophilus] ducreyi 35000HP]AAP95204.1 pyridoxamine-5'-phosphate oxidase [[Haemophilus] ducreyi 35000HP]AKO39126.1 pyridoxamine 5'-phosphate oxidase [[Haemophilus] ducreyi]ASE06661.1 pyridoxine/pyridoxamine 5'-phosphate oxidase [[Haemophilus] ducreyi]
MDLHNIRADYTKQQLSKKECDANPMKQFERWLNEAIMAKVNEPTAMNMATVIDGKPTSRIVLLKEVDQQGFIFFTNYQSCKGWAIALNPYVALTFFWPELERSVRVEGIATKLSEQASDDYFASRPYASRIGAWASDQSQVLSSKRTLVAKVALLSAKYPLFVPRPAHWGGYLVQPTKIEFWQGRPSWLHDRICYWLVENEWLKERLSP